MPAIRPMYHYKGESPRRPTRTVKAIANEWTGSMYDLVDATRVAPNRTMYRRAQTILGDYVDPQPRRTLIIEADPFCDMEYRLSAHKAWAHVGGAIGLEVWEVPWTGPEVQLANWWQTLWKRWEWNSPGAVFHQANTVPIRHSVVMRIGMQYKVLVKTAVIARASGKRGSRQSWAYSKLKVQLSEIPYRYS